MNKTAPLAVLVFLTLMAGGCSLLRVKHAPEESPGTTPGKINLSDSKAVKEMLYLQYRQWKDTGYALGGLSKQGIDCSGLVYVTYLEKLGIELPRTTELQAHVGKAVERGELRPADLVFFKTGAKLNHVGMYIDDETFLHVSKKQGVTISKLNDHYWGKRYWHSRRVGY